MTNPSEGWTRVPAILSFADTPGFTETYGFAGASGKVWLEGQYLIPRERPRCGRGAAHAVERMRASSR